MNQKFLNRIKKLEKQTGIKKHQYALIFNENDDGTYSKFSGNKKEIFTKEQRDKLIEESRKRTGFEPFVINVEWVKVKDPRDLAKQKEEDEKLSIL